MIVDIISIVAFDTVFMVCAVGFVLLDGQRMKKRLEGLQTRRYEESIIVLKGLDNTSKALEEILKAQISGKLNGELKKALDACESYRSDLNEFKNKIISGG